jgi:hypothetical protein
MFDFIFDNGVIFIAIAIFVGRLILQFRRKSGEGEEGKKPPSQVPGFFEEKEVEEKEDRSRRVSYSETRGSSDFLRELYMREAAAKAAPPPPRSLPAVAVPPLAAAPPPLRPAGPPEETSRPRLLDRPAGFPASLDRFSPLKRAVILAEILGPPKGN